MQTDHDSRSRVPRSAQVLFPIPAQSLRFTLLLGMLAALPSVSIDISAPTLMVVGEQLAASPGLVALTISLFMFGFALGQLAAGPLSDQFGRRPMLMLGLVIYSVAALGCGFAGTIQTLIGLRLVQGAGAGACAVLAFTMVHDLFKGDTARSKRSYVTVVFGLAPMVAPSIGALVLDRSGWRPIYLLLALGGILLIAAVGLGIAETRPGGSRRLAFCSIRQAYQGLLRDRRFSGLAAVNALSFGGMFAYIAGSPFVLMGQLHLSSGEYGAVFASTAAALTAGAWVSGRLATAGVRLNSLLWLGLSFAAGSAVLLTALLIAGRAPLPVILFILELNLFCRGIIAPNAQHLALEPIREDTGAASAAIGVMQILMGAVASAIVAALLPALGPVGMGAVMAMLSLGSLGIWIGIAGTFGRREAASTVVAAEHGV